MVNFRKFGLFFASLFYIETFRYVYIVYLNPIYGSQIFSLHTRQPSQFITTAAIAFLPILFYNFKKTPSSLLVSIIYSLYYIPSVLVIYYTLNAGYDIIFELQISLMLGMCTLFSVARYSPSTGEWRPIPKSFVLVIYAVTILLILTIVITFRGHMQFVSFKEVYSLRYKNDEISSPFVNRAVMYLTYCLLPFALARAYVQKDAGGLILGVVGCAVIYASTGAKAAILTPFMLAAFYFLLKRRGDIFTNCLLALTATSWVVIFLIPDEGPAFMIKPVFFGRVMAMTGWLTSSYYKFFSSHQYTYLSQIGIINSLTGMYPYGAKALGEVFGISIPGQSINAGFWASEGIASFGIPGIYFATGLAASLLLALNRLARSLDWLFVEVWLCGFAVAFLNLPLSTMMFSGGGMLILIMLFALNAKIHQLSAPKVCQAESLRST